jgi:hypothetical protein
VYVRARERVCVFLGTIFFHRSRVLLYPFSDIVRTYVLRARWIGFPATAGRYEPNAVKKNQTSISFISGIKATTVSCSLFMNQIR